MNGGFEEADDEGKPFGWRKYGGELGRSSVVSREGQYAAAFTSRTTSTKWVFQTVTVRGGQAYVLSGYALKDDVNVEAAYLRVSWYASPDGSGRAIDIVDSTTSLADDSSHFRFLTTDPVLAPVEAASAKVRLMLDPVSESKGEVYFDDISFVETTMPPPTQTPVPSPPPKETATPPEPAQTAPSSTPGESQGAAPPAVKPAPPSEEPQPPPTPTASRPSSTLVGAAGTDSEAILSNSDGHSQGDANADSRPARTPVVLYRERKGAQSVQGGQNLAGAREEGDGLSPVALALTAATPAALGVAAAFFVWRRWQHRARPP
ncbi:MAG: hypothetical protein AMJ77_03290 [Dehalococcoidia bacterium SM23_28_2]|nr:MAG: hypothetical protein AMJ77_03290 [Dehalococcoidia bacterium SM23_28_2]